MIFSRYQQEIETELKAAIGINPSPFYQMMRYHMGWIDEQGNTSFNPTGKLLRPSLCLLSCDAVGGVWQKALPAASMLELVHNFSLIHDDIEDRSEYRRHRKTVWSTWGDAQSINVGDGMSALSRLSMLRLSKNGYPVE
ncbi:MAG: polyprenyl synthetase family protein [Chloroflexi bacterium]|nr:polyprenyl synthetase family protein [Chloroflexota bacterium]